MTHPGATSHLYDAVVGSAPPATCRLPVSHHRTLVLDGLYFARHATHFSVERLFDVSELAALRQASPLRVAWPVLFLKAQAIVAKAEPLLRRWYQKWPWPHFYQTDHSVGMLVINRRCGEEERICWARFSRPDEHSLADLQQSLDCYQREPVDEVFRQQVRFSRMPMPVRRLLYWFNLNFAGGKRAKRLGTFTLSTLAGQGALNRAHPTLLTSSLTYGPMDAEGQMLVTLLCDHRVLDGAAAARALLALESVLRGPIADEIARMSKQRVVA